MLLVLTEQLRSELHLVRSVEALRDALSNLARAHREGKHIVSGSQGLLRALSDARELPDDVRGTFRQIKARHFEAASVRESVRCLVEIEACDGAIESVTEGARQRFRVPLSYFGDSARTQATRLVGEDSDDARIYRSAAKAYVFLHSKDLTVRLDDYGGGGDSTADALRDHAHRGLAICVVDADHKWTEAEGALSEGKTAAAARRAAHALQREAICAVHAIPCREIENLFPAGLVRECLLADDRADVVDRCERAARLGLLGGGPEVNRLDLKNGLCWRDVAERADGPGQQYLRRAFDRLRARAGRPAAGWCDGQRRCDGGQPCTCIVFEGLGIRLAKRVADRLDKLTPQKTAEHLLASDRPHEPAWTAVGAILFAWGCAYPRART
jgi:hypothetical protein